MDTSRSVTRWREVQIPNSASHPLTELFSFSIHRSKTADIERMLQINRAEPSSLTSRQLPSTLSSSNVPSSLIDNKKYTKRRYTDSRHQTRHIPDAESLATSSSLASRLSSALHQRSHLSSTTTTNSSSSATGGSSTSATQPVWKRRELISSAPKERSSFF